jgi:hypothetical protein
MYEQAAGWTWGQPQRHLRHRHRRQRHRRRHKTDGSRTAICATKRISPLGSHAHSVCVRLGERRQGIRPGRRLQKYMYEQAAGWTWGSRQSGIICATARLLPHGRVHRLTPKEADRLVREEGGLIVHHQRASIGRSAVGGALQMRRQRVLCYNVHLLVCTCLNMLNSES